MEEVHNFDYIEEIEYYNGIRCETMVIFQRKNGSTFNNKLGTLTTIIISYKIWRLWVINNMVFIEWFIKIIYNHLYG